MKTTLQHNKISGEIFAKMTDKACCTTMVVQQASTHIKMTMELFMYTTKESDYPLLFRYTYLLTFAITTNFFCADNNQIANGSIFVLPREIIPKVVILQGEPNTVWINQLILKKAKPFPKIQQHIFPCYRLLMTCTGFYHNHNLKESLCEAFLSFPLEVQQSFIIKENGLGKLNLKGAYIKDCELNECEHFFKKVSNEMVIVKRQVSEDKKEKKILSLPEFLIQNMDCSFANEAKTFALNHLQIEKLLKNHFRMLNWVFMNTDLTLPAFCDPRISIAEFFFDTLRESRVISSLILDTTYPEMKSKDSNSEILEVYKKRYELETIPETIPVDLTLLLSDDAFEKLSSTANSKIKNNEYNKKLFNWILPELPKSKTRQSWFGYFIQRFKNSLSTSFKKICLLITMIKNCLNNHI